MIQLIIDKFVPLVIYFSVYILTLFLVKNAENQYYQQRTHKANRLMTAAVIVLSLFAALRAETVGTDILVYAKPSFDSACTTSMPMFSWLIFQENMAYALLVYLSANVFNSFPVLLFLTELCIAGPLAVCMVKNRKSTSITITMLVFLTLYYPMTFNVMRQSISVAFLLLGYFCFKENKKLKALISLLLAFAFHSSALIMLLMLIVAHIVGIVRKAEIRYLFCFAAASIAAIVFMRWQTLMHWAIYDAGLLPVRFGNYLQIFSGELDKDYFFANGLSTWIDICIRLCNFVFAASLYLTKRKNKLNISVYYYSSLMNILIYMIVFIVFRTTYGYRIVMCFDFMNCFYFAALASRSIKRKRVLTKFTGTEFMLCCYSLCCWLLMYVIAGMHEVFPYTLAGL